MARIKPEIGKVYLSGTIKKVLSAAGKSRAIRVEVTCIHCSRDFVERFTIVRLGQRVSCACKKTAAFREYWAKKAAKVSQSQRTKIFEYHELHRGYQTAEKFQISRYLATSVWIMERRRLAESQPALSLVALADKMQGMSNAGIQCNVGLSVPTCLAICRIARRLKTGSPDQSETPELSSLGQCSFTPLLITHVIIALSIAKGVGRHRSYRLGELLPSELSKTKKAQFNWAYHMVLELTPRDLRAYPRFQQFLDICEFTFRQRQIRRCKFLSEWASTKRLSEAAEMYA